MKSQSTIYPETLHIDKDTVFIRSNIQKIIFEDTEIYEYDEETLTLQEYYQKKQAETEEALNVLLTEVLPSLTGG